jgi:outer membrane protein OmpA-like peptidoglycan-associated protein
MKPQTRIFSVATTIACLAISSPGFAQAYVGGSGQPAVQVDLGALNDLPGPAPTESYPAAPYHPSAHYRSDRVSNSGGDIQTTFVGGGDDTLAPVTPVYSSRTSPYAPARHIKPARHRAAPKHKATSPAHVVHHARAHPHRPFSEPVVGHAPRPNPSSGMTTEELNDLQLHPGNAAMNNAPIGVPPVRSVSMLPPPQPAESTVENTPPYIPPKSPAPLPPQQVAQAAIAPPDREDYDKPRHQPTYKAEPPLPPTGPAPAPPAASPDDLIDEGPQRPSNTRIVSDSHAPSSTPGFKVGYYDIPSKISLSNPVPQRQAVASIPPAAPAPQAPVSMGLPQAPALPAPTPAPAATLLKVAPPIAQDTTQSLNRMEEAKTPPPPSGADRVDATPLDAPTPLAPAPAPGTIQKAKIVPSAPMAAQPASPSGNDDLGVSFAAGSVVLSPDIDAHLNALAARLQQNPDLRVELRSVASAGKETTSKARRTSLSRALAIKSYLSNQGISEDRIDVRALGAPPGEAASDRVDFFLMR